MPITIIDSLGVTRYLGNNVPPDEPSTDKWPIFRATITEELIPRDQWNVGSREALDAGRRPRRAVAQDHGMTPVEPRL